MAGCDRDRRELSAFAREVDPAKEPDPGYGDGCTDRVSNDRWLFRGTI
jgi:hypothetical protein